MQQYLISALLSLRAGKLGVTLEIHLGLWYLTMALFYILLATFMKCHVVKPTNN